MLSRLFQRHRVHLKRHRRLDPPFDPRRLASVQVRFRLVNPRAPQQPENLLVEICDLDGNVVLASAPASIHTWLTTYGFAYICGSNGLYQRQKR